MEFNSINPYNGKEIKTYKEHSENEINGILEKSQAAFESLSNVNCISLIEWDYPILR